MGRREDIFTIYPWHPSGEVVATLAAGNNNTRAMSADYGGSVSSS